MIMIMAVTDTGDEGALTIISLNTHAIPGPNSPSLAKFASIDADMDGARIDSVAKFALEIA